MWDELIVAGVTRYLESGLCVALLFVLLVGHVEPSARGGSILFRLLIIPGAALLWPWVVLRSLRAFSHHFRSRAARRQEQRS